MSDKKSQLQPTLAEMAEYLNKHETHRRYNEAPRFSWNIKVRDFDSSGKNISDFTVQHRWGWRWDHLVQEEQELFGQCCEDGLRIFFDDMGPDNHYFTGVADDHPLAGIKGCQFYQRGRSGGYLVLEELDGRTVDPLDDWTDLVEEDPRWLTIVYCACKDVGTFDPKKELENQYAFRRHQFEETWDEEAKQSAQEKKDLKLIGTFIYLRAHPERHRAIIDAAKRLSLPVTPDGGTDHGPK